MISRTHCSTSLIFLQIPVHFSKSHDVSTKKIFCLFQMATFVVFARNSFLSAFNIFFHDQCMPKLLFVIFLTTLRRSHHSITTANKRGRKVTSIGVHSLSTRIGLVNHFNDLHHNHIASQPVQIFFSHPVVLLSYFSWFAFVRW